MPVTRAEFEAFFPRLVDDITAHSAKYGSPEQAQKWFRQNLNHNSVGGKYNRGMSVIDTTAILQGRELSDEETFKAATLGWCIELLQAFFLVSDDIMDSSKTRRGSPCWYLMPKVGMIAINDAFMLESSIYVLLKKHFKQEKSYVDLLELFHEVTFQTELGQTCDLLTAPEDHVDLNNFAMEKFVFIVIYKTAYYSFYLPVALAMYYVGIATQSNLKQAHDILIPMGEYFQAQDDYLDAFADPETLGKIGTDIQDNKCSWLVNTALAKATPEQRKILDENYGIKDAQKEKKVKALYQDLELEAEFFKYEEAKVADIKTKIEHLDESAGLRKEVFEAFLKKIYKRSK